MNQRPFDHLTEQLISAIRDYRDSATKAGDLEDAYRHERRLQILVGVPHAFVCTETAAGVCFTHQQPESLCRFEAIEGAHRLKGWEEAPMCAACGREAGAILPLTTCATVYGAAELCAMCRPAWELDGEPSAADFQESEPETVEDWGPDPAQSDDERSYGPHHKRRKG